MRTDQFNVMLVAAVVGWVSAQILKTIFNLIETKKFDFERLIGAGGMPSSHSATVCALAVTASKVCGVNSPEFALAMILALVVMYDACGVRRAAGLHAREINRLSKIVDLLDDEIVEQLDEEIDLEIVEEEKNNKKELKEFLGHTPFQVMCGALLGIIIGLAFSTLVIVV
ncbi:MAG: divergent PAP2 family protein [Ruminiclostridium sp.]|nr:divergent PAP2 family protein [Ruminiclostridium sp.]MBQ8841084.1 divergent PAP2 family protein [Ruminiclostridium sp.]